MQRTADLRYLAESQLGPDAHRELCRAFKYHRLMVHLSILARDSKVVSFYIILL